MQNPAPYNTRVSTKFDHESILRMTSIVPERFQLTASSLVPLMIQALNLTKATRACLFRSLCPELHS